LVREQILLDDEIYHAHRILARGLDAGEDDLALDLIARVGPRGHFLAQNHTRQRMRDIWIPALSHPRPSLDGKPIPEIRERARAQVDRILAEHQPEPLEEGVQGELRDLLDAAAREFGV
jgi:trimethylamine--corrinoid protein Co-methyltransferase